jgi:hypothetical protein
MVWSNSFCSYRKLLTLAVSFFVITAVSFAQNAIVTENSLPGNPISEWGVPDFRDNRIAGFATKISLNAGETVRFKINVQSGASYNLRIYRIGYYAGNGARLMQNLGTLSGTVQPAGISDPSTGILDCSNWSESANWTIPSNAVSGLYIARIERTGGGSNHIIFIVRNDASNSDLYLQFPDATWQAYNGYGGNSMYDGSTSWPAGHAVKASYNRPFFPYNSLFNTDGRQADWYMNATYPMIRWLERNGYDITYTSCNDVARNGSRLLNHKIFISIGHDEYISKQQRANIEAARNAGVHLAFFSGNEFYWKTRWENDNGTEDRTLVCYKEGFMGDGSLGERTCGYKCDPSSEWTGLWRTGGNYDAGTPENGLTGQISWLEYPSNIQVPAFYKKIRLWRNTSVANLSAGQTASLGVNTLGYEWDYEQPAYASSYPPGRFTTSSTTLIGQTHKLSLYRHSSGALVFGAGTVQWSWGLDGEHWGGSTTTSTEMQQATINLFADMGVQPGSIQSGLTPASQSTDFTAPTATISSPSNGATFSSGATVNFSGSSTDGGGGVVTSVEISTNGGSTWTPATITAIDGSISWSYSWSGGANGTHTIRVRGVDDSGNIGNATTITITIGSGGDVTPPTVSSVSPTNGATGVSTATTVSATFSESINSSTVTTSTFQLRDAGNNLVSATVSTSGNQITLTPSSALTASTTYTVTITGGASGVKDLAGNALASNYSWSFTTAASADNTPPTVSSVSPINGATGVNIYTSVTATFSEAVNASTVTGSTFQLRDAGNNLIGATVSTSSNQITLTPTAALTISTTYTVTIVGGASGVKDLAGNALASNYSWSFTTGTDLTPPPVSIQTVDTKTSGSGQTTHSLTGVPAGALLVLSTTADAVPMDCAVSSTPALTWTKRADAGASQSDNAEIWTAVYTAGGSITVRSNWGGDHSQASVCYVVLNAEPVLGGASATGVSQSAPSVTITTTRENSIVFGCSADFNVRNGATRTLRDGATDRLYYRDGNYTTYHYTKAAATIAAYTLGVSSPTGQSASTSLLEIRSVAAAPDNTPPTVSSVTPANGTASVPVNTTVTAVFSEAMSASTINASTIELRNSSNVLITATVSYNTGSNTATLTPSAPLANSTVYTATVKSGAAGVKDVAGNALASDYNWSFTTEVGDIVPPTVSSVTPANGAANVSINTTVTAIFSEAMNAATISTSTIELRNSLNALITATVTYNAGTNTATLTPSAALAISTVYTATIKSGAAGVKDVAGNALASDYSWSFTTEAGDITAPVVVSVSPLNGATGVAAGTIVSATLSEAINASTVTGTTFQLRDGSNNLVSATVSTSSNQITLTPAAALTASTTYTVTITGGASGVKDLAGNALASNYSWSFTTAPGGGVGGTTYTVFQTTDIPDFLRANDGSGIVLGMRFRSTQDGFINGIRYYKGAGTTGTHIGTLWSNTGTLLTQVTFTNETASGWQEALLSSPFAITAGVTYVVTYFSPSGDYSATKPYFTQNKVNGPLIGLQDGLDGLNGLYRYSATNAFPSGSFQSSNYWVDVVFGTNSDNTAPTVSTVSPLSGATGVNTATTVSAIFSESVNSSTVTTSTFQLRDAGNNLITATVSTSGNQIILTPSSVLTASATYTATITGGASGVKDMAGNALASNYSWSFTTAASADNTPPTVLSVSPLNGATGVSTGTTVTAILSEAINASTVTGSTFQLRDAGNNLISATVSTLSNQITLTPSAALSSSATHTVTIVGGASGVKDLAGNALANNYSWSFTTATSVSQPVTIQTVDTKTSGSGQTTHSLTGVPAGALLVLATTADAVPMDCAVSSTPALTWTKRVDAGASQSDNSEIWTAVYTAGGSITVRSNWGQDYSQASVCYVVLNAEPVLGGASATGVSQSAPSVTITTTRENSIVFGCSADFNVRNGATRTLRDAATERLYYRDGNFTTYHYSKDAAAIGAYTLGVSAPTGQSASTALLEIRSAGSVATRPGSSAITSVNNTNSNNIINTRLNAYNSLGQNFPNPFNKVTNINFTLAKAENVNLVLLDITGRVVKVLANGSRDAGTHVINFNVGSLRKGIYYYRIHAGNFTDVKKLIIW